MSSKHLRIRDCAILVGFDPTGKCVYSDGLEVSDYYDGEHVWDSAAKVKRLRLQKVKGFLFDEKGCMFQEFESLFDPKTGRYVSGWIRHADGTITKS